MSQSRSKARESLVHWEGKDSSVHEWNIRPKALVATVSHGRVFSRDQKKIQAGRDPRRALVQPPGWNHEARTSCSGLSPDRSGEPPRMEAAQPLQATFPTAYCPHREKAFSCTQSEPLQYRCRPIASCPPTMQCWVAPGSVFSMTSL